MTWVTLMRSGTAVLENHAVAASGKDHPDRDPTPSTGAPVFADPQSRALANRLRLEDEHVTVSAVGPSSEPESGEPQDALARVLALRLRNPGTHLYDEVEGLLVAEAFRIAGGNQVHTALLLGISRNVVRTLLKKHGLLKSPRNIER